MKISFNANALLCAAAPALLYHTKADYGSLDSLLRELKWIPEKGICGFGIKDYKKIVEYKVYKAYFNLKKYIKVCYDGA